jgi:hypothetical protein
MARSDICDRLGDPSDIAQEAQDTLLLNRIMCAGRLGKRIGSPPSPQFVQGARSAQRIARD